MQDGLSVAAIRDTLQQFQPSAIYLFGSAASGQVHPGSDIDIAILPKTSVDPYAVFLAAQKLADLLGCEVDLVDLSRSSPVFKAQVIGKGRLLENADPFRTAEFEMYALSDYARVNEERRVVLDARKEASHA